MEILIKGLPCSEAQGWAGSEGAQREREKNEQREGREEEDERRAEEECDNSGSRRKLDEIKRKAKKRDGRRKHGEERRGEERRVRIRT